MITHRIVRKVVGLTLASSLSLGVAAGCQGDPDALTLPEVSGAVTTPTPEPTPEPTCNHMVTPAPTPCPTPEPMCRRYHASNKQH